MSDIVISTSSGSSSGFVAGGSIQNAVFFSSTTTTSSSLNVTTGITKLDGYVPTSSTSTTAPQSGNASFFMSGIDFSLNTPIYANDENDVIAFQVCLNSSTYTYNANTSFYITCYLSNLGKTVSSPTYEVQTSSSGILTIALNKWFAIKAPGSTYRFTVCGIAA